MSYASAWSEMAPFALLLALLLFALGMPAAFVVARRWRRALAPVVVGSLLVACLAGALAVRDDEDAESFFLAAAALAVACASLVGAALAARATAARPD